MKFRKKPVVIEAWQIPPNDEMTRASPPYWVLQALMDKVLVAWPDGIVIVHTLEGAMRGGVGDWIIKGVKGEMYPCKPDIFAATYEPES